jgi:predicted deacylase
MTSNAEFSWLPVTVLADGSELRLPLHILRGKRSGPTLGLTGMIHGNEPLPTVAIMRQLFEQLNPDEVSGTIMAVPVCNPLAAGALMRNTPLDGMNLNDAFGEPQEDSTVQPVPTVSGQIAAVLKDSVLPHFDYHIDFHTGTDTMAAHMVEFSDEPESIAMARAFNMPILLRDSWGEGQLWGASARHGAKVIVAELGGGSLLFDEWLQRGVDGTLNVMRRLGMLPGEVTAPPRQRVVDNTAGHHRNLVLLRPRGGGLLLPEPEITARVCFEGQPIAGPRTLAKLVDMYDFSVRERYETPFENTLLLAAAVRPSWHAAGDFLYIMADADIAEVWD